MAPKKTKASKMSLNEFLGDSTLGSWADEMDALPSAPSIKTDEDRLSRHGDRFNKRDDFASSRSDRQFPPREEIPLPSQPPFTAFIGNLAFDITETELATFFSPHETKSIKIIKDRDDKPKGFGYIEFAELDALKDALSRTGTALSGRTIRVSVAEPPKEKGTFGGSSLEDDTKFSGNWRRDGPMPSLGDSREPSRRRFDGPPGERVPPTVSEEVSDWRSSRPLSRIIEPEAPPVRRRGSAFPNLEGQTGVADKEEQWVIGGKFKASATEDSAHGKFGSVKGKHEPVHPRDTDEGDWRTRKAPGGASPTNSTPPTPQISRKKLELLPRSSTGSTSPSPLSSPKLASSAPRASPFGAAKPVDLSNKEREVAARVEKERELLKERGPQHSMSRTNSKQATERGPAPPTRASPTISPNAPPSGTPVAPVASTVRPSFSFANAAGAKGAPVGKTDEQKSVEEDHAVDSTTDQAVEMSA